MANFFSASEEENLELIGSWWQKYKFLIIGLFAFIFIVFISREMWLNTLEKESKGVIEAYDSFIISIESIEDANQNSEQLGIDIINKYPNSLFAKLSALQLAKINVDKGLYEEAEFHLNWLLDKTSSWGKGYDPIEHLARLRLARIFLEENKIDEALKLIDSSSYQTGSLYEVKGDILNRQGKIDEARINYYMALEQSQSQAIKTLIDMKIADLHAENE